ncbi:hypothetical protein [Pseudomonas sp.]|uniref:hypothetical protein n=1 Tax=Pseudomonas sp. TaxID=306 RepID=UPI0028A80AB5|nr:hypothetical protein [Pseudomonas sp.]
MASTLLAALPSLHGTVAGIGVAFISAFLIQAQQKIHEISDRADDLLEEMKEYASPDFHFQSRDLELLDSEGRICWPKVQQALRSIRDNCLRVGDAWRFESLSRELQLSMCQDLIAILYRLHVSYPFTGFSLIASGQSETYDFESIADEDRLRTLKERTDFLAYIWGGAKDGIIALATRAMEVELGQSQAEADRRFAQSKSDNVNEPAWDEAWSRKFWQDTVQQPPKYDRMVVSAFHRMISFREKYVSAYEEVVEVKRRISERYKFKEVSLACLFALLWVFGFGVVVPLLVLELESNLMRPPPVFTPYFVLVLSIIPYCIGWYKVYRWVKDMRGG